jgi:hypothetical protein
MNDTLPVLRRHRLRRHRLRLLGVAAALVVGVLLLWAFRTHGPDPRIEAIHKKGYPATLAELDAWYAPVPEATNLALVYMKVFASPLFTNQPNEIDAFSGTDWLPARSQPLAPEDRTDLSALLATNAALLRPFYACSGPSRYPVDLKQGFAVLLPHLARCKAAVNLLTAAALLHAENGQREQALQDFEAAGRVADSLAQEPLLISQLVRMACWGIMVPRLERVLNLRSLSDGQLARLQALFEQAEQPQCLLCGLAGEQAAGLSIFQDPVWAYSLATKNGSPLSQGERMRAHALVAGLKAGGFFAKDRAFYLDTMATNVATAELPFPERVQIGQRAGGTIPPGRLYIFSNMLLPALGKTFTREADYCARLRVAQTALAIERFRLAHTNALPASLDDLVPAYLKAVPIDPYDGKPLRFKLRQPGYVVYSLGQDGKDDGGLEPNPKNSNTPHDITFILEK